ARSGVTPEEDPLAVDALFVAEREVLVGAVDIDRDAELGEAGDDASGPAEAALLDLQARPRGCVRRRLLGLVAGEGTSGEVQGRVAHGFDSHGRVRGRPCMIPLWPPMSGAEGPASYLAASRNQSDRGVSRGVLLRRALTDLFRVSP